MTLTTRAHVLVCPRRLVPRFTDLTADETSDLWLTAQKVGSKLETYHNASSLTLAIQVTKHLLSFFLSIHSFVSYSTRTGFRMVALKRSDFGFMKMVLGWPSSRTDCSPCTHSHHAS